MSHQFENCIFGSERTKQKKIGKVESKRDSYRFRAHKTGFEQVNGRKENRQEKEAKKTKSEETK